MYKYSEMGMKKKLIKMNSCMILTAQTIFFNNEKPDFLKE